MYKILKLLNNKQIKTLVFVLFLMLCVAALETFSIGAVLPLLSTFTNQSTELEFLNNFLNHFRNNDNQKNLIIFSSVIIIFSFCTKNIFIYLYICL